MVLARYILAMLCLASTLASTAAAEPFYVEMRDGSFKRCGNLDYKKERGQWRMRGCEPIARLLSAPTTSPQPTASPRPTPRPTPTDPCPGGCITWDPITDTTKCVRPCP